MDPQQPPQAANNGQANKPPGEVVQPLPSTTRAPVLTRKIESGGKNAFISGIHPDVTDEHLRKLFEPFGEVQSTHILTDMITSKSRGMGFVHFNDPQSVLTAMSALDGKTLSPSGDPAHTTAISVRVAFDDAVFSPEETNKLFIRNLPPDVRTNELAKFFSQFGRVMECSIHKDISSKGIAEKTVNHMAYVTFGSIPEANNALEKAHKTRPFSVNGKPGMPLLIKRAESIQCRNIRLRKGQPGQPGQQQPQHQQPQQQQMGMPNQMAPQMMQPQMMQPQMIMPVMGAPPQYVPGSTVPMMVPAPQAPAGTSQMGMSASDSWGSSAWGSAVGSVFSAGNSSSQGATLIPANTAPIPSAPAGSGGMMAGQPMMVLQPDGTLAPMMMPQQPMPMQGMPGQGMFVPAQAMQPPPAP